MNKEGTKPTSESERLVCDGKYVREREWRRYGTEQFLETGWISLGFLVSLTENWFYLKPPLSSRSRPRAPAA